MPTVVQLRGLNPGDKPPPMLPPDVDLRAMSDVMVDRVEFLKGARKVGADHRARMAHWDLYMACIDERPVASLPSDSVELSYLVGMAHEIEAWNRIKDKALEGWTLCSDGRYYHRELSIRVLNFWIKRLLARRKSDDNNAKQGKAGLGQEERLRSLANAGAALASVDPHHPLLKKIANADADIGRPTDLVGHLAGHLATDLKRSEAKPSESMCVPSTHIAPARDPSPEEQETGKDEGTGKGLVDGRPEAVGANPDGHGVPGPNGGEDRCGRPPWPPDFREIFWPIYPRHDDKKKGMAALERVKKSGLIAFDDLMEAVRRYAARVRSVGDARFIALAATWLNGERWNDPSLWQQGPRGGAPPPVRTPAYAAHYEILEELGLEPP